MENTSHSHKSFVLCCVYSLFACLPGRNNLAKTQEISLLNQNDIRPRN